MIFVCTRKITSSSLCLWRCQHPSALSIMPVFTKTHFPCNPDPNQRWLLPWGSARKLWLFPPWRRETLRLAERWCVCVVVSIRSPMCCTGYQLGFGHLLSLWPLETNPHFTLGTTVIPFQCEGGDSAVVFIFPFFKFGLCWSQVYLTDKGWAPNPFKMKTPLPQTVSSLREQLDKLL